MLKNSSKIMMVYTIFFIHKIRPISNLQLTMLKFKIMYKFTMMIFNKKKQLHKVKKNINKEQSETGNITENDVEVPT